MCFKRGKLGRMDRHAEDRSHSRSVAATTGISNLAQKPAGPQLWRGRIASCGFNPATRLINHIATPNIPCKKHRLRVSMSKKYVVLHRATDLQGHVSTCLVYPQFLKRPYPLHSQQRTRKQHQMPLPLKTFQSPANVEYCFCLKHADLRLPTPLNLL